MNKEIKEELVYDTIIVGFGVAAITAAIYASRKGLKTAIIGTKVGGQVLDTQSIENIIGFKEIKGVEFSKRIEDHLNDYEVYVKKSNVIRIEDEKLKKVVTTDNKEYLGKTVIIATGAKYRKLNIEGEVEFTGKGIHYCSTCDGPFYRNLDVVVVGGGNSGVEAALELKSIAKSVKLLEYSNKLNADSVLVSKLEKEEIPVILNAKSKSVSGNDFVTELKYIDMTDNLEKTINTDGVFVEIGLQANTDFVEDLVKVNNQKEIIIDKYNMTSVEGIFAAGDCTDVPYKQIVIAIGEAAKASLSVFTYLLNNEK